MQPAARVAHDRRCQAHERGGFHPQHVLAQVEIRDPLLERRLVGGMDDVGPPGQRLALEAAHDLVDAGLDLPDGEAGGAEEPEHSRAGDRYDQAGGSDAVGHRPGHVGKADAVRLLEAAVAQPFGIERGEPADHLAVARRWWAEGCGDGTGGRVAQHAQRLADSLHRVHDVCDLSCHRQILHILRILRHRSVPCNGPQESAHD